MAFTGDELSLLRAHTTQVSDTTRMVGMAADVDSHDYETTGTGHEVWIYDAAGDRFDLTPGTNGQCGGSTSWPAAGSESEWYWWSTNLDANALRGNTGGYSVGSMEALPPSFVLPTEVDLVVATGGGVAFGWETETFLIK